MTFQNPNKVADVVAVGGLPESLSIFHSACPLCAEHASKQHRLFLMPVDNISISLVDAWIVYRRAAGVDLDRVLIALHPFPV